VVLRQGGGGIEVLEVSDARLLESNGPRHAFGGRSTVQASCAAVQSL
jgi:hypothetical protein